MNSFKQIQTNNFHEKKESGFVHSGLSVASVIPKTLLQIRCLLKCHQLYNLYICSPYLSLTKCILYHLNYVLGKTPRIRNQLSVCQQLMLQLSTEFSHFVDSFGLPTKPIITLSFGNLTVPFYYTLVRGKFQVNIFQLL